MPRSAIPPMVLVLLAGLGDAVGAHGLAFYLLVIAVPAAAVAALLSLDASLQRGGATRALGHAWLQALALVFLLVGAAARAPDHGAVPRVAVSAFAASLIVFGLQALVGAAPTLRAFRRALRPSRTRLADSQ